MLSCHPGRVVVVDARDRRERLWPVRHHDERCGPPMRSSGSVHLGVRRNDVDAVDRYRQQVLQALLEREGSVVTEERDREE